LHAIPSVSPPLRNCLGLGFVENLLEKHEPVSPKVEVVDFAIISLEPSALDNFVVQA
jgi:hypothetical protein